MGRSESLHLWLHTNILNEIESELQRTYFDIYAESFKTKKQNKGLGMRVSTLEKGLREARESESSVIEAFVERVCLVEREWRLNQQGGWS